VHVRNRPREYVIPGMDAEKLLRLSILRYSGPQNAHVFHIHSAFSALRASSWLRSLRFQQPAMSRSRRRTKRRVARACPYSTSSRHANRISLGWESRVKCYGRLDCGAALEALAKGGYVSTACFSPTSKPRSPLDTVPVRSAFLRSTKPIKRRKR